MLRHLFRYPTLDANEAGVGSSSGNLLTKFWAASERRTSEEIAVYEREGDGDRDLGDMVGDESGGQRAAMMDTTGFESTDASACLTHPSCLKSKSMHCSDYMAHLVYEGTENYNATGDRIS